MWMAMLISYTVVSLLDIRSWYKPGDKRLLIVYLTLMTLSCILGIANEGFSTPPSPAGLIEKIVNYFIGR